MYIPLVPDTFSDKSGMDSNRVNVFCIQKSNHHGVLIIDKVLHKSLWQSNQFPHWQLSTLKTSGQWPV
jgi:hypothetical protein